MAASALWVLSTLSPLENNQWLERTHYWRDCWSFKSTPLKEEELVQSSKQSGPGNSQGRRQRGRGSCLGAGRADSTVWNWALGQLQARETDRSSPRTQTLKKAWSVQVRGNQLEQNRFVPVGKFLKLPISANRPDEAIDSQSQVIKHTRKKTTMTVTNYTVSQ